MIEKIPNIVNTIEIDTIGKFIEVLSEISKDDKIKSKMFNEFKIYFESQSEHDEYIRKFVALLIEFIYSTKYKVKDKLPFIISNIQKMMEKANGRVARRILSLMMTKVKPYLTEEEVDAIGKRFFSDKVKIKEGSEFVIPALATTHILSNNDHKMKDIIPALGHFLRRVPKKGQTSIIRKSTGNLHDQARISLFFSTFFF